MLHILWLIVKFILITLGVLLGLALLLLLLLLFCPVRYRAQAAKGAGDWKELQGSAGVSWLFHAASVLVSFREGEMKVSVRVLGIPLERFKRKKKEKTGEDSGETLSSGEETKKQEPSGNDEEQKPEENVSAEKPSESVRSPEPLEKPAEPEASAAEEEPFALEDFFDAEELTGEKTKKKGLFQRFREKLENIGLTFGNIRDKIEQWKKFIHHPRTAEALSHVWKHGKFLLKHILPTKLEGDVTFGCENPAHTGQILAVLGMSFPLHRNRIAVHPLFDGERVLEGEVRLKGRICGIVPVWVFLKLYFNKNVKYVIRRVKRTGHKEG